MKRKSTAITRQDFDRFLAWIDPNPDCAGELYTSFHRRLVVFFAGRRCGSAAAELASETLDRAAERFVLGGEADQRDPARYLFSVAHFIALEHFRSRPVIPLHENVAVTPAVAPDEPARIVCCRTCLSQLPETDRSMLQDYYLGRKEGEAKRIREQVASDAGKAQGALRIKVFRLKQRMLHCMNECLQSRPSDLNVT